MLLASLLKRYQEQIRFLIVGGTATIIQYLVYIVLIHYFETSISLVVGYFVSFFANYFMTIFFTFRVKSSGRNVLAFFFCHLFNLFLQMITLNVFIKMGISQKYAPFPMYMVCVPVNFLLISFFIGKNK